MHMSSGTSIESCPELRNSQGWRLKLKSHRRAGNVESPETGANLGRKNKEEGFLRKCQTSHMGAEKK